MKSNIKFLVILAALAAISTGCSKRDYVAERNMHVFADTAKVAKISGKNRNPDEAGYPSVDRLNAGPARAIKIAKAQPIKGYGVPSVNPMNLYGKQLPVAQFNFERRDSLLDSGVYKVKKGDTLKSIAKNLYGSEARWKDIFYMNKKTFEGARKLKVGMKLHYEKDSYAFSGADQFVSKRYGKAAAKTSVRYPAGH